MNDNTNKTTKNRKQTANPNHDATTKAQSNDRDRNGCGSRLVTLLKRHAFVITFMLNTMSETLKLSVRGQFRYRFFHAQFVDELSQYNVSSGCGVKLQPEVQALENKITQLTERWRMYDSYASIIPLIVSALLLGMKSDQIGRRFLFLFPVVTSAIDCIIMATVVKLGLHYGYSVIGAFVNSLSAGEVTMYFASFALVSDTHGKENKRETPRDTQENPSDPDKANHDKTTAGTINEADDDNGLDMTREHSRTRKVVLLTVVQTCARAAMFFVTGYIIQYAGFFYTMVIVIGCKVFMFVFAFLFVSETGKQKKSADFFAKHPQKRITLLLVNGGLLFALFSYVDEYGVLRTYQMSPPFCFTSVQLGWFGAVDYFRTTFTIPLLALWRRLRLADSSIAAMGMVFGVVCTLLLSLIRVSWIFYVASLIETPADLTLSMARVITSRIIGHRAL
ncbi:hypothetical protein BaRGS_00017912, partial [Batillaria attramentaria]